MPALSIRFSQEEIKTILSLPFSQCVSSILNFLFDSEITPSELDFRIGRFPVRTVAFGQKISIGECWHNAPGQYLDTVRILCRMMGAEKADVMGGWRKIGVTCAVLAGILGQIYAANESVLVQGIDIAAFTADLSLLAAGRYLKAWGFPIRNLICSSVDSSSMWDLVHNGSLRTDAEYSSANQDIPAELERLLYETAGSGEAESFACCARSGVTYVTGDDLCRRLQNELVPYVVSKDRVASTISGVFGSHGYLLSPETAAAYAALMDHRCRYAAKSSTLLIAERSPACDSGFVAQALHINEHEFMEFWKNR